MGRRSQRRGLMSRMDRYEEDPNSMTVVMECIATDAAVTDRKRAARYVATVRPVMAVVRFARTGGYDAPSNETNDDVLALEEDTQIFGSARGDRIRSAEEVAAPGVEQDSMTTAVVRGDNRRPLLEDTAQCRNDPSVTEASAARKLVKNQCKREGVKRALVFRNEPGDAL
ncbi:uncharacterized protein PITG_20355 [Phytophthora infestans T30-4]|uniref:Uncharacterized protein n=1 Tax=Phytophthora infestans (strain T30-4) TaxID=403677 RepID=D0P1Q7_PHYIT|nr:uncharacterized protein PITG_20355 [Phytophthora infestans T30-4]EEY54692.1 conserved hypothetical protein [Phytophthora infestans T30-4]|eukprot:XP_002895761.1 conserved hypothetical protein [Phytophthora infestans T30-4]